MKRIIFFTHARLGDLHVSRTFVKKLVKHAGVPAYYYGLGSRLLADCGLEQKKPADLDERHLHSQQAHFVRDGTLYVNTWYAAGDGQYVQDGQAALFDTLYRLFDDVAKTHLGCCLAKLGKPADFLPDIDFSICNTQQVRSFLRTSSARKVLVANGRATAGQARLFPMLPPLAELGRKFQHILWIYTNKEHEPEVTLPPNVRFLRDLTGIRAPTTDLNECGFVSTFCDLIVGRFSGAYTFSMIKPNLLHRRAFFLTFSDVPRPRWLGSQFEGVIPLSCRVTQTPHFGHKPMLSAVERALAEP
jgi:hypothetical protein